MNVYAFTPASDTAEIRSDLRGPQFFNTATQEMWFVEGLPSVPTRHRTFVAALTAFWLRLLTSPAADHLRAAARSTFWPLVISSGVVLALLVIAYLQGIAPSVPIR